MVATNFDTVFVLSSLNRDFSVDRILRYVTQAKQSGGQPVTLLTKADLAPDRERPLAEVAESIPGVPVHAVSSHSGLGLSELERYLAPGLAAVLLGMSGVGKSSLLNALMRQESRYVQNRTSYLVDKIARHKTAIVRSKHEKKNGGKK
ncbi:GTPase RsgA [Saccharibacillus alkalitolerans]|uniref:GTPase RsgA n=1 Tax=Saccharibacillus alkalitolerans TaxID=2705290 RepID=A0ABX0F6F2_9BACL|nr:GTPase RsgA [Saccharibacillus alkalitolerans]NGZ76537.1 GTPase RsgA [Saccharibacillus alkalitolerans]